MPPDGNTQFVGASRLHKHDLETGGRLVHEFGDGHVPGEFVFVPAHAAAAEDEGWLLGLVIDEDAPVATIRLPHRIPPGFHGNWFPAAPPGR